jgi:hypothetical protein
MTEQIDKGSISDGYHTFNELYEHRHALVLALMKAMPRHFWFSRRHHDGELCFGDGEWFIVGAELPDSGTVTYHLPMRLWGLVEMTGAAELELGRPWDGHTANDVVHRLKAWASRPSTPKETAEDIFHQNLSSLRGRFERIVFTTTSPDAKTISYIEVAGRLIDAVVSELAPIYTSKEQ